MPREDRDLTANGINGALHALLRWVNLRQTVVD